jgi:hypothetical protein
VEVARALIDPQKSTNQLGYGLGLSLSILNTDTIVQVWGVAHHYCYAVRNSHDMDCDGMSQAISLVKDLLPKRLAVIDYGAAGEPLYDNNNWVKFKYEFQVCSIAEYVFDNWIDTNTWYPDKVS